MGYVLKLIVGYEYPFDITHGGLFNRHIQQVAEIDLSAPGGRSAIYKLVMDAQKAEQARLKENPEANRLAIKVPAAEYSDVSEIERLTDHVGYPLVAIDLKDVYLALHDDWEHARREFGEPGYRRFAAGVKMIEAIMESFSADRLVAVPWGH